MYIIACIVVVVLVVLFAIPWKWNAQKSEDSSIPDACGDCNRGDCRGCRLEGLTKEQANSIASQITQQAIADGTVYTKRFEGR